MPRPHLIPLCALAAGLALAAPSAASADIEPVVSHAIGQSQQAVRGHWTPERMRGAKPLDGPADATAGTAAAPNATAASQPPDTETDPALDTAYPQRIHGRLFITYGDQDATCSATVVTSRTRDLILTAGHCVAQPTATGPQFATNVAFVPGYRNGAAPFGVYVATRSRAPFFWAAEGDISLDVGAVNLAPAAGVPIQNALGSRGVSFNRTAKSYKRKRFRIFGYPAEPSAFYDGERLIFCNSPFRGIEKFTGALKTGPCHQQEGSSGGGLVLGGGILNSVVSHNGCQPPTPACQVIASTYFGPTILKLWSASAGGLPKGRKKQLRACKRKAKKKRARCVVRAVTFKPVVRP